MIYLQKDEDVFVKYGDAEAKLYYEMEEANKKLEATREKSDYRENENDGFYNKEKGGYGQKREGGRGYNKDHNKRDKVRNINEVTVEEAKEFGLNFRDGPPKFKNDKKKDEKKGNLRDIINEEKEHQQENTNEKREVYYKDE